MALFPADIFICHESKSTGVPDNISNGRIPLSIPVPGLWYYACWPTGTPKWNKAILNVISYTCAFPTEKSKCLL